MFTLQTTLDGNLFIFSSRAFYGNGSQLKNTLRIQYSYTLTQCEDGARDVWVLKLTPVTSIVGSLACFFHSYSWPIFINLFGYQDISGTNKHLVWYFLLELKIVSLWICLNGVNTVMMSIMQLREYHVFPSWSHEIFQFETF